MWKSSNAFMPNERNIVKTRQLLNRIFEWTAESVHLKASDSRHGEIVIQTCGVTGSTWRLRGTKVGKLEREETLLDKRAATYRRHAMTTARTIGRSSKE